ncbi:MAG: hypothetical protein K0S68_629 [Candidatus Saccharibacteria bacterium]|jgi:hypothetical protein|nr:hypothetical protein [Candidatus Saccharibacteria bacterium]
MESILSLFKLAANACGTKTGWLPSLYDPGQIGTSKFSCDAKGNIQIDSLEAMLVVVANATKILLAVAGSLAIIAIIAAGIYFIISTGDPGRIKRAKDILINTVVGLVLIIGAYAVVQFISGGF